GLIVVAEAMPRNSSLTLEATLPPELWSHGAGIAEFRDCRVRPLDRLPVHLDRVNDLLQTRGNHGHLALGQVKLHPADGLQDFGAWLHRPELGEDARPIEPEQIEPDDGIDDTP